MENVTTAFTSAGGDIVTQLTSMVVSLLPTLLPLLGIGLAIGFGISIIRKVTNRSRG
jgi:hypothetical protein